MLILILVDIQYLQNVVFSFEKDSNGQKHSSSDSHPPNKKIPPQQNVPFSPPLLGEFPPSLPFKTIWNTLSNGVQAPIQPKKHDNKKSSEVGDWLGRGRELGKI